MPESIEITEMPTKETLEAYMSQMILGKEVKVIFNTETGVFEPNEL